MPRILRYLRGRFGPALTSDEAFVEAAYLEILGRPVDQDGLDHYRALLRDGLGRTAVLLELVRSDEFRRSLAPASDSGLPDLRAIRPDRYRQAVDRTNGQTIDVFDAASAADIDWLESSILEHGYYEKPGVWNFGIDTDKRVIAEMIAAFEPKRPLELGCAAGAVLECLDHLGIEGEGIEISAMAIARAAPRVGPRIHHGDLLDVSLPHRYDVVFGLDVFEHLNPNRLDRYVARLAEITTADGLLYCNIPAFGEDPVFGTVFPFYLDDWAADAAAGRPFSALHVDERGYPIHGHLAWADWAWWEGKFTAHGFTREPEIERAMHGKYDRYLEKRSPARKAFFVFAKQMDPARRKTIAETLKSER